MQTREIICEECGEKIGTLAKETITDEDLAVYRETVVCANGHSGKTSLKNIERID